VPDPETHRKERFSEDNKHGLEFLSKAKKPVKPFHQIHKAAQETKGNYGIQKVYSRSDFRYCVFPEQRKLHRRSYVF